MIFPVIASARKISKEGHEIVRRCIVDMEFSTNDYDRCCLVYKDELATLLKFLRQLLAQEKQDPNVSRDLTKTKSNIASLLREISDLAKYVEYRIRGDFDAEEFSTVLQDFVWQGRFLITQLMEQRSKQEISSCLKRLLEKAILLSHPARSSRETQELRKKELRQEMSYLLGIISNVRPEMFY
jgi:hypothetical protein